MKFFEFKGRVSDLVWSIMKILFIMIGSIVLASILPMIVQHWSTYLFLVFVGVVVTIALIPSIINTVIKYLVNHTQVDSKKLIYTGSVADILTIIIVSIVISMAITAIISVLILVIYATFTSHTVPIFLMAVVFFCVYALAIAFLYAWFVIRMYTMIIQNIQIEK